MRRKRAAMKIVCRDLGRMDYADCWKLQQRLFGELLARKRSDRRAQAADDAQRTEVAGDCANETADADSVVGTVLSVEHPPVYTLGKSGRSENLLVDPARLSELGATFFHIDRGGDITFHGPGQLVCYPILDLEPLGIGLRDYIGALEECVIRTVARYGIRAGRVEGASGVWIDTQSAHPRKLCAIGVRSSRFVTMHGFALNVTTDLAWFSHIHPCGFTDRGVASIASETGLRPPMEEVKRTVVEELGEVLGCSVERL